MWQKLQQIQRVKDRWGSTGHRGGRINAHRLLVGQHEEKKPLGIHVKKMNTSIKTELSGRLRVYGLDSPDLGEGQWSALMNKVINQQFT
jgi:hypothetical protein